jgi:hypothetical protein
VCIRTSRLDRGINLFIGTSPEDNDEEVAIGKRSDFKRLARDCYDTPLEAVEPLLPHLAAHTQFIEPAAGAGCLMRHLQAAGHVLEAAYDIEPRADGVIKKSMLELDDADLYSAECAITNPPWGRFLFHQLILHLRELGIPAWLLCDANWMFTQQAAPFLRYCETIITVGRVVWIPGTKMTGKDDCAWFHFRPDTVAATTFVGKPYLKEVRSRGGFSAPDLGGKVKQTPTGWG